MIRKVAAQGIGVVIDPKPRSECPVCAKGRHQTIESQLQIQRAFLGPTGPNTLPGQCESCFDRSVLSRRAEVWIARRQANDGAVSEWDCGRTLVGGAVGPIMSGSAVTTIVAVSILVAAALHGLAFVVSSHR